MIKLNFMERQQCADALEHSIAIAKENVEKAASRGPDMEIVAMLKVANLKELQGRLRNCKDTP